MIVLVLVRAAGGRDASQDVYEAAEKDEADDLFDRNERIVDSEENVSETKDDKGGDDCEV